MYQDIHVHVYIDHWYFAISCLNSLAYFQIQTDILLMLSRYNNYLASYRVYRRNYEHQPDFTNPPSFLKEYETQVHYHFYSSQSILKDLLQNWHSYIDFILPA